VKWAAIIVGALALVVALVAGIGAMLPVGHLASRRVRLKAAPEDVWRSITTIEAFPSWRSEVARVERLPDREGQPVWREHGAHGAITFEQSEAISPRRLVSRIADPDLPFGGTWTYEITPEAGGSAVTITERGEVRNVAFRFMSRFVFGHATTIEGYLRALGKKHGEVVVPEPLPQAG
jgi:uncharacterized protein YndB with AHSA1/START domain